MQRYAGEHQERICLTAASACGKRTKHFPEPVWCTHFVNCVYAKRGGAEAVMGRGQLVSWTEDILFTRLDIHDAHWKSSRKTLARAFSADEIRRAQLRI